MLKEEFKYLAKPQNVRLDVVWASVIYYIWQKGSVSSLSPDTLRRVIGDIVNWVSLRDSQVDAEAVREVVAAWLQEAVMASCLRLDQINSPSSTYPPRWDNGYAVLSDEVEGSSTYGDVVWLVFLYLVGHGKILPSPSGLNALVDKMITPLHGLTGDKGLTKTDVKILISTAYSLLMY